jgi:hypothetical protein
MLLLLACTPAPRDSGVSPPDESTLADTTDTTDTAPSGDSTTDTGEAPEPFVLEAWTDDAAPGLQLHTNLPPDPTDCAALSDAPCEDLDADGLVDAWEALVLDRLRPVVRMDEDEPLISQGDGLLINIGRIWPVSESTVHAVIVLAYSEDYGRCGLTAHHGDSERVALSLTLHSGSAWVSGAYTAAHEGELNDGSALLTGDDLSGMTLDADSRTGEPRWVVFSSEGKHATYTTAQLCEDASFLPCLEEDCAPDNVTDKARFDVLPEVMINAGEPDAPLADDLTDQGMPGEQIWADQTFCGGLGRTDEESCSSGLLEKMLSDPLP